MDYPKSAVLATFVAGALACDGELPEGPPVTPVAEVVISGDSVPLVIGGLLQLTATTFAVDGTRLTGHSVSWRALPPSGAIVSSDGLVRAAALGPVRITASAESVAEPVADTVELIAEPAEIVLFPQGVEVGINTPLAFEARLFRSDGRRLAGEIPLEWTTSDETVAVADGPVVTALGEGRVTVTANSGSRQGSTELVVSATNAAIVTWGGQEGVPLVPGAAVQLSAVVLDGSGAVLPDRWVEWSSANPGRASVSREGVLSIFTPGTVEIQARAYPVLEVAPLTADSGALLLLSPEHVEIVKGGSVSVRVIMVNSRGNLVDNTPAVEWSTSNPAAATVDMASQVTSQGTGVALISASTPSQTVTLELKVDTVTWEHASAASGDGQHSCAIDAAGRVFCWGSNFGSQAGPGALGSRVTAPIVVATPTALVSLNTGRDYSCARDLTGQVYCWGSGAFGNGNIESGAPATLAAGGVRFLEFAGSSIHSLAHACGIDLAGKVLCWGDLWNRGSIRTPQEIPLGEPAVGITAGANHDCALGASGAAYCWGRNYFGVLGDGTIGDSRDPVAVAGGISFQQLAAGREHTCGLADSLAYCWGDNGAGRLGTDSIPCGPLFCALNHSTVPLAVQGGLKFGEIRAGGHFTCGLTGDGQAYCWGASNRGQRGDGSLYSSAVPVPVAGGLVFTSLSAGHEHACGVGQNGRLYCWGANAYGQLGNGTLDDSPVPVEVPGSP